MQKDFYLDPRQVGKKKIYYVKFRDPVTRKILNAESSGHTNKTRAEAWASEEWNKRVASAGKSTDTLREWSTTFFLEKCPHESRLLDEGKRYSPKTKKDARRYLDNDILTDPIADMRLVDIRRPHILAFRERTVQRRGRTRAAGLALQTLRVIIREALERGVIETDPVHKVANPAYTGKVRTAVGMDQVLALLAAPTWEHEAAFLATMTAALTGLRAGEVRGLQWGDLDKEAGRIRVVRQVHDTEGEKVPKWGKLRTAAYPKSLQAVLEPRRGKSDAWVFSIVRGAPLSYRTFFDDMRAAATYAGVPGLTPHGLRHSLNSALRSAGASDELIRASFGWSDPSVQEGYSHRDLYDLSPQAAMIDTLFKEPTNGSDKKRTND